MNLERCDKMQVTSNNDNVQSSDVKEDSIRTQMPHILDILLLDRTTSSPDKPQNIIWANDNYKGLDADAYSASAQIRPELITGSRGSLIMPRALKTIYIQKNRTK